MDIKQANIVPVLLPKAVTGPISGDPVDIKDFDYCGHVVMSALTTSGTSPTLDVSFEESDSPAGPWTVIPGLAFGQVAGATATALEMLAVEPSAYKRYIRARLTPGGTGARYEVGVGFLGVKKDGRNASQRYDA